MSSASPNHDSIALSQVSPATLRAHAQSAVRAAGFWTAVSMPFLILGALAGGVAQQQPTALVIMVALNIVALALGQNYNR